MNVQAGRGTLLGGQDLFRVLIVAFMALMVYLNPIVSKDNNSKADPGIHVHIMWPQGDGDVDHWDNGPGEEKGIGFSNKTGVVWNLLRDDMGNIGDPQPANYEASETRGIPAGEYTVNLHGWRLTHTVDVTVTITIVHASGAVTTLYEGTIPIAPGQERTVLNWQMDGSENVVGKPNSIFKPLVGGSKK